MEVHTKYIMKDNIVNIRLMLLKGSQLQGPHILDNRSNATHISFNAAELNIGRNGKNFQFCFIWYRLCTKHIFKTQTSLLHSTIACIKRIQTTSHTFCKTTLTSNKKGKTCLFYKDFFSGLQCSYYIFCEIVWP